MTYKPENIVVICGIETVFKDGVFVKFSSTFRDNSRTIVHDNPRDKITIVDARDYVNSDNPLKSLWDACPKSIDRLIYIGHSDTAFLYVYSKVRKELPDSMRMIGPDFDWGSGTFNELATIELHGCQTVGQNGKVMTNSIAQAIANATGMTVSGFVYKSSQRQRLDGRYYQKPEKGGFVKVKPQHKG